MNKRIPKWVLEKNGFTTQRKFKEHFRKKFKALDAAQFDFISYSAYIPIDAWELSIDISIAAEKIKRLISQKEWGR